MSKEAHPIYLRRHILYVKGGTSYISKEAHPIYLRRHILYI